MPPVFNSQVITRSDRSVERLLRDEIGTEVSRLLGERQLLTPGPADEQRIRTLIHERVAGYQRRAASTNAPLLLDPAATEQRLFDGLLRLGILQPFMDAAGVEEIICNGPNRVFVIEGGQKRLVPDLFFDDDEELRALVKRLIGPLGRRLDESSPMVDARLPDGSRLNAAIPPATTRWCCLTIRKFVLRVHSLEQLVRLGTLPEAAAQFLDAAVQGRVNILVSGPTGSGKCVSGDTLVALADGQLRPIGELVEAALTSSTSLLPAATWRSAPVSQAITTCDFERHELRAAAGVVAWRHPAPETLIEVQTRTGKSVRVTPEHPFFTVLDGEIQPIRADQLHKGDRIAVASSVPTAGALPDLLDLLALSDGLYVQGQAPLVRQAIDRIMVAECQPTRDCVYASAGLAGSRVRAWQTVNALPIASLIALLRRADISLDALGPTILLKSKTSGSTIRLERNPTVALTRLAGLVTGDGHLGRVTVELTSGDPYVRKSFQELACESFGLETSDRVSGDRCPTLLLRSSAAVEVLHRTFGVPRGAKAKVVRAPNWLLSAPEAHIAGYLSGLLDTDGSVTAPGKGRSREIDFWTSSRGLAEDIVALLLRLGVRSHLRIGRKSHRVHVYHGEGLRRLRDVSSIAHPVRGATLSSFDGGNGYSSVDVIPGLSGPLRRYRQAAGRSYAATARTLGVSDWLPAMYERGERHPTRARVLDLAHRIADPTVAELLLNLAVQPVFWDRVVAARPVHDHGEAYVYDLTVPDTHNFLAGPGGIVAHNTTFLNALGASIASLDERVITVEEVAELQLDRLLPDAVGLQARAGNVEGVGEIRIRELVRNALRMRPTRIVVGEVRGAEALDMLLALNTGHAGSLTTIHGNSSRDALDRLATLAMMAEERLTGEALTKMVARTVELVLQLRFEPRSGRRRLVNLFEVTGMEGDVITGNDLWALDPASDTLTWTGIQPRCLAKITAEGVPYVFSPGASSANPYPPEPAATELRGQSGKARQP